MSSFGPFLNRIFCFLFAFTGFTLSFTSSGSQQHNYFNRNEQFVFSQAYITLGELLTSVEKLLTPSVTREHYCIMFCFFLSSFLEFSTNYIKFI